MAETWVLNATISLPSPSLSGTFTSNGKSFTGIERVSFSSVYSYLSYTSFASGTTDSTRVYENGSWIKDAYRTLVFDTAPTGAMLTWLQANGQKQSESEPETPANVCLVNGTAYAIKGGTDLIDGTSYQIGGGRTLVDGTRYEVRFEPEIGLTWYFNSVIDVKDSATYVANFVSDGVTFTAIRIQSGRMGYKRQGSTTIEILYINGSWRHEKYRTVTFEEPPSGALLEWLQANAVQQ